MNPKVRQAVLTSKRKVRRFEDSQEQLLPGIPNDITLDEISTKLSRRELHVLACVSRGWNDALRDHQIYDARVRSHSREPFIVLEYVRFTFADFNEISFENTRYIRSEKCTALVLCRLSDNSCFKLPCPIKYFPERIPWCQCVTLDGKVYVLGGLPRQPSNQVYVLDLAGLRPWRPCARMHFPRCSFACTAMDGKIYVFGGANSCDAEMFDPLENKWTLIKPMPAPRPQPLVVVSGKELVVYGETEGIEPSRPCDIYDPVKDEWRRGSDNIEKLILKEQGKYAELCGNGLRVHGDVDDDLFDDVDDNAFVAMDAAEGFSVDILPICSLLMGDETFVTGFLVDYDDESSFQDMPRQCIIRSKGFGMKREMAWREQLGWPKKGLIRSMHLIRL